MLRRFPIACCLLAACSLASAADPPAPHYGGQAPPAQKDADADAVAEQFERAAKKARVQLPKRDALLDAVARRLAALGSGPDTAREVIDHHCNTQGLIEPSPTVLMATAVPESLAELAADLGSRAPRVIREVSGGFPSRQVRYGVGAVRSAGIVQVVVTAVEHTLELDPVPRVLPAQGSATVKARLLDSFHSPTLIVSRPGGQVVTRPMTRDGARSVARFACDGGPGRYRLEIGAEGPTGPEVLANFPVYCGVKPPSTPPSPSPQPDAAIATEREAELAVWKAINADRGKASLGALKLDTRLSAIARAHCDDMRTHEYVGHVSPRTGSPMDRVRQAGLHPSLVAENVSNAPSVEDTERGFMESPGHRGNVLLPDATHVGVGVRFASTGEGRRKLYVTQLFARF